MDPQHEPAQAAGERAIRALVDDFVKAIRAKNVERLMSMFAPDVVSFDLGPPLRHGGGEAFSDRWRALFQGFPGTLAYEVHDLQVSVADELAFSHSLNRMAGATAGGGTVDRWLRWTACYRKADGRWRIVHEHVSVPVDVRHGTAVLDGRP